jgi:hypothetical protein
MVWALGIASSWSPEPAKDAASVSIDRYMVDENAPIYDFGLQEPTWSMSQVALMLNVNYWQVDYLKRKGLIPNRKKVAGHCTFTASDIRMICQQFGKPVPMLIRTVIEGKQKSKEAEGKKSDIPS